LQNSAFPFWRENSDEGSIRRIIFPNSRHRVHRAEWTLDPDNDIAVGRDCKIKGARFRICGQPGGIDRCGWSEGQYGVIRTWPWHPEGKSFAEGSGSFRSQVVADSKDLDSYGAACGKSASWRPTAELLPPPDTSWDWAENKL
jgi:hypothetical protein